MTSHLYFKYETVTRIDYYFSNEVPALMFCIPRLCTQESVKKLLKKNFNSRFFIKCDNANRIPSYYEFLEFEKYLKDSLRDFDYKINFKIEFFDWFYYQEFVGDSENLRGYYPSGYEVNQSFNLTTGFRELLSPKRERCFLLNTAVKEPKISHQKFPPAKRKCFKLAVYDLFYPNDTITLGLYSRSDAPSLNQILIIKFVLMTQINDILYNNLVIEKLEPPYRTKCRKYFGKCHLQTDCIVHCFITDKDLQNLATGLEARFEKAQYIPTKRFHEFVERNESNANEISFRSFANGPSHSNCLEKCPPDCIATTYYLQLQEIQFNFYVSS